MKKVLIDATIKNFVDHEFLINLVNFFKVNDFECYVHGVELIDVNLMKKFTLEQFQYDFIVVINKQNLEIEVASEVFKIYCMNCSHIENIYAQFNSSYDLCLEFGGNEKGTIDSNAIPVNILYQVNSLETPEFKYDTLVIVQSKECLLKILPFFNSNYNKKIAVYSKEKETWFNEHITLIGDEDLSETLTVSRNIVGEGPILAKAILMGKRVLVVGENGFGGIINNENILGMYHTNFLGRIGGSKGEVIPLKLLESEFEILNNVDEEIVHNLKKQLSIEVDKNCMIFKYIINSFFDFRIDESFLNASLKVNNDFGFTFLEDDSEYIVYHRRIRTLLYSITKVEFLKLNRFENGAKISEVFTVDELQDNANVQFIREVLRLKMLTVIYDDNFLC